MEHRKSSRELRESVLHHFDAIAPQYDQYKKHSEYYYSQLKLLLKLLIGNCFDKRIIEIGCGTGSLLAELAPRNGLGIDLSERMIQIATERWRDRLELEFRVGEAEVLEVEGDWDFIVMCDVLEHLYDPAAAISRLDRVFAPGTRLILTWANNLWEPLLIVLERLRMKMPEGDHNWETFSTVQTMLKANNFKILKTGTRCIVPARIPFADFINRRFIELPVIRRLGLIRYVLAEKNA